MRRIAIVGTLMTAMLAGGQAFANHPPASDPAAGMEIAARIKLEADKVTEAFQTADHRRRYRRPDRDRTSWELLGQAQVRRRGYEEIDLSRGAGRFTRVMLAVDRGSVFVRGVRITFANGDTFEPEVRGRLDRGQPAITIDLPGNARAIDKIEFFARDSRRYRGSATVNVWGERIDRDRPHRRGGWY